MCLEWLTTSYSSRYASRHSKGPTSALFSMHLGLAFPTIFLGQLFYLSRSQSTRHSWLKRSVDRVMCHCSHSFRFFTVVFFSTLVRERGRDRRTFRTACRCSSPSTSRRLLLPFLRGSDRVMQFSTAETEQQSAIRARLCLPDPKVRVFSLIARGSS
jgi:hypothetical protein